MSFKAISIGAKITGSMIILLAIMLSITVISFFKIEDINLKSQELTDYVIPLSASMNLIDTKVLEQQIIFERIVGYLNSKQKDPTLIKKELAAFKDIELAIDAQIDETTSGIRHGIQEAKLKRNIVGLSKVEPLLHMASDEHEEFHQLLLKTIKSDASNEIVKLEQLSEEYDNALDRATLIVQNLLTQESQDILIGEAQTHELSLLVSILAFLIGAIISPRISRGIVSPLKNIITAARSVGDGDLSVLIPISSNDEVGELSRSFNSMTKELIHKEEMKQMFGKYVDPRIVDELLLKNDKINIAEGQKKNMTIFFSDIENFTTISEALTPHGLVTLMNKYFSLLSKPIYDHKGVIDKYIGDAIMAFWGDPFTGEENHAKLACLAALEQFKKLDELNESLAELLGFRKNLPIIKIRIGLSTGDVIAGSVGSSNSKSYTVMGDTVNVASRLESINKQFGTRILISESTFDMVKDDFVTRKIDNIIVMGKSEPVYVYELLGRKGSVESQALELIALYEDAYALYQQKKWNESSELLIRCLHVNEEDKASRVLLERIKYLSENPPENDWDGVWSMTKK